jgi:aminopeptidase YwaD
MVTSILTKDRICTDIKGEMMTKTELVAKAERYLNSLCVDISTRRVGSQGNQQAVAFFAETTAAFGFATESIPFDCIDLEYGDVELSAGGQSYAAFVSPYSLGWSGKAPLVEASMLEALEALDASGKILLLRGDITKEQLMPKNFTFFNPDHHKQIYQLIEKANPLAIIAATSRNPELAGGMYPFPLIEDGDFDIPSIYMTEEEGRQLAQHADREINLSFEAERIPSKGSNVYARKGGRPAPRIVVCAHIDAKDGTPGALDNAVGVVVLLLLAELLESYAGDLGVELVAINGEDYYGANGEVQLVQVNQGKFDEITLAVNIDAAGYIEGDTHYSTYGTTPEQADAISRAFAPYETIDEGPQWYQSDHSIFIQNGRPAVAITSKDFMHLSTYITHTTKDKPELVDPRKLVDIALGLRDLIEDLYQAV